MSRPDWDDYFMGLAFMVSHRSPDPNTKHGCIIVDEHKIILGIGYNGWPSGMDDKTIPNNRPKHVHDAEEESKYDWVIHSEENAILNCSRVIRDLNATAYITGQPCQHCTLLMVQAGIKKFVIANRKGWQRETEKSRRQFQRIVQEKDIEVQYLIPNLDWIISSLEVPMSLGFVLGNE